MVTYYHRVPHRETEKVLKEGIKPGIELGIKTFHLGMPVDNGYLYLWKNLNILQGNLYHLEISSGCDFLEVELSQDHPIERDLDAKILLMSSPHLIPFIIEMLQVDFDPKEFVDEITYRAYIKEALQLPERDRPIELGRKVAIDLSSNPEALVTILKRASGDKWDEVFGFYR